MVNNFIPIPTLFSPLATLVSFPNPPQKWKEGLAFLVTLLVTWCRNYMHREYHRVILHQGFQLSDSLDCNMMWSLGTTKKRAAVQVLCTIWLKVWLLYVLPINYTFKIAKSFRTPDPFFHTCKLVWA